MAHVFRKYFKTVAEGAGMRSINIEMLMGHSIGVSNCYYRPTEDELLKDYLKAVPAMTFETPVISAKQLQELKETQARNADAIAAIVEEMHRQQAENAALNAEIARLKKAGASTSMLEELEKLELQLDEMRRMHLAATGGRKDSANIDG